jgi:hypothetical protein
VSRADATGRTAFWPPQARIRLAAEEQQAVAGGLEGRVREFGIDGELGWTAEASEMVTGLHHPARLQHR